MFFSLLLDTSFLNNLSREKAIRFIRLADRINFLISILFYYLFSFKKELNLLTIIIILSIIYSTIIKLTSSSSSNSSLFTISLSIVSISIKFISINNLKRIVYYLYSFVTNINSIAIPRKVVITANYIASNYSRSKTKSTQVNVIKFFFSIH